jgi:hypothetical protein
MISKIVRGVIRGRTIELESEPGFADGEEVDVVVQALQARREVNPTRVEEAQASDEIDWDEWDAIMEEIQRARKIERGRSSDEE